MTKLKEDKAPKFKLNFFHIKKDSCENINQFDNPEKKMKEKSKSDRIKINRVLSKNSPVYNNNTNSNINSNTYKSKQNNIKEKKGYISRDKKLESSSKTHREFVVYKKDLLTKIVKLKKRPTTSRAIINNKTNKNEERKITNYKNGSNNIQLPVQTIYPSNQIKTKKTGIHLINKLLLNNKEKIQKQNISYSTTSLSLTSLLKSFQKQKKIQIYDF